MPTCTTFSGRCKSGHSGVVLTGSTELKHTQILSYIVGKIGNNEWTNHEVQKQYCLRCCCQLVFFWRPTAYFNGKEQLPIFDRHMFGSHPWSVEEDAESWREPQALSQKVSCHWITRLLFFVENVLASKLVFPFFLDFDDSFVL